MFRNLSLLALCLAFAALGCSESGELTQPVARDGTPTLAAGPSSATGGGHYLILFGLNLDTKFSMGVVQQSPDGAAEGRFHHSTVFQGELVEFHGRATCVAFDAENGRAWIGGVITENRSTHPGFQEDVHQPGRDIWFRVVDYGEGENATQPDRSTFVGFEGNAGIITSAEYCEEQIWPAGDERTNPVTEGDIQVRVR